MFGQKIHLMVACCYLHMHACIHDIFSSLGSESSLDSFHQRHVAVTRMCPNCLWRDFAENG